MRTFIVSDLHGQGKIYNSMINYLSNLDDEVKLYINGDVIDRGEDSIDMLLDIMNRDNIDIEMLAGNHELFLYEYAKYINMKKKEFDRSWFYESNGGKLTSDKFDEISSEDKRRVEKYLDDLKICVRIPGIGDYEGITISHAKPFLDEKDYDLKLSNFYSENGAKIFNSIWYRDEMDKNDYGVENCLNIVGHTPVQCYNAFFFRFRNNILNIDGGCSLIEGSFIDVEAPLVEVDYENNRLDILGFNKEGIIVNHKIIDLEKEKDKVLVKK